MSNIVIGIKVTIVSLPNGHDNNHEDLFALEDGAGVGKLKTPIWIQKLLQHDTQRTGRQATLSEMRHLLDPFRSV